MENSRNKKKTNPQWQDLDAFLLCNIFARLSLQDQLFSVSFVCRSWLSALLHSIFDHPNLDLTPLQNLDYHHDPQLYRSQLWRLAYLLKLAIRHCRNWVSLSLPTGNVPGFYALMFIAQNTPNISRVMVPSDPSLNVFPVFMAVMYWKNLRVFHAPFRANQFIMQLADYCKKIEELGLHGSFSERDVSCIVEGFPGLKVLDLSNSTLPAAALRILVDGRLKCIRDLNVMHCKFLDEDGKDIRRDYVNSKALKLEVLEKSSRINSLKKFMHCLRGSIEKPCEQCPVIALDDK